MLNALRGISVRHISASPGTDFCNAYLIVMVVIVSLPSDGEHQLIACSVCTSVEQGATLKTDIHSMGSRHSSQPRELLDAQSGWLERRRPGPYRRQLS